MIHVRVDVEVVSPNLREHWGSKARRVKDQREATVDALRSATGDVRPPLPVRVKLCRVGPGTLDDDNLAGSLKAFRDATASWLRVSDAPTSPITWAYGQVAVKVPSYATVRIEPATEAQP